MNEKARDDLTVIKGIGPVWQKRLRETLDVRTFQDLAALSSDEIVSELRPAPTVIESESWIRQAQELVAAAKSSIEAEETGKQTNSPAGSAEWKPVASFVVEFLSRTMEGESEQRQTKVQHMETDTNASWPGIENVALCRWMLEQMGETEVPELEQEIEETRIQAQRELEQELEERQAAARQELEQTLEEERSRAREALQKEADEERTQARRVLEQELAEKRGQAQLELDQLLDKERARARRALQEEFAEEFAQVRKELEQAVAKERVEVQKDVELKAIEEDPQLFMEPLETEIETRPEAEEGVRPMVQPPESRLVPESHSSLAITQLRAFQPIDVAESVGIGIPGQPFSGHIKSSELFTFAVEFELAEPAKPAMVQQGMTYQAQFYVRDLLTGAKEHLGNTSANSLVVGRSTYNARLTNVTLKSGFYELTVLVTIQNRQPRADYLMVPFFQVT